MGRMRVGFVLMSRSSPGALVHNRCDEIHPRPVREAAWPTPGPSCESHSNQGYALQPDAYRLAFADPEFLLRRETRGLRMQLEMLKPESRAARAGR